MNSFAFRRCRSLALPIGLGIFLSPVLGQSKNPHVCGSGVSLQLSAPVSSQGSLLLAEVRSRTPIAELSGEWNARTVAFWPADGVATGGTSTKAELRTGLIGVDLEMPPGTYKFRLAIKTANDKQVDCSVNIPVRMGKFATERLQVEKQFVEPSPEQVERANQEGQKLRAIYDTTTPDKLWKGAFRVPLDGWKTGGNFGKRRVLNGNPRSPHGGVDFPSPTGTPVHAAQQGRVVLAQELFFSGNTVVLDHGLGIYTFYGHLSQISVKEGDMVEAGTELGKVGATGRVTGPHLHWALTVERARVNPLQIVSLLGSE